MKSNEMDTVKQNRCEYVGGSDLAAAFGLSDFATRKEFYEEKINGVERDSVDTIYTKFGVKAEPLMREFINKKHKLDLVPSVHIKEINGVKFRSNNDGQDEKAGVLAEFKTNKDGKLQDYYLIQALDYALNGLTFLPKLVKIVVLKRPKDFETAELDEKLIKKVKEYDFTIEELTEEVNKIISGDFVEEVEKIATIIKKGRDWNNEFGAIYGKVDVLSLLGSEYEYSIYKEYKELETLIKTSQERLGELEVEIEEGKSKPYFTIVPARVAISNRFSAADFKKAHADLYAEFTKPSETNYKAKIKEIK